MQMYGGWDGNNEQNVSLGTLTNGFSQFLSAADVDISLIMTGKARGLPVTANTQLANWLMQNIAQVRKDCIVFTSPDINLVVNQPSTLLIAQNLATARNNHPSTSYGFMDSGYKYMYDRYNDVFRWVPLNGDMAGLCAQTDLTNAAWWSPAGFNRGNVKNVTTLAWNPKEADRDILYTNGINPVVSFKNQGTVLFGDKTLLNSNSAFSRINVRRLFIVLEKAIATASQFTLFEFNDAFTRSQFKAMVNPFLQQIKGQRGITAFYVRCDSTNNPPFITQNNEFVADIFIMPNYSINWIKLNFINVPPTLSFTEAEQVQF
jgi:phage tail sheath protein FI